MRCSALLLAAVTVFGVAALVQAGNGIALMPPNVHPALSTVTDANPPAPAPALMANSAETDIRQSDAYRQQNPLFEQCIERADRLAGQFGVGHYCGNVAQMTKCSRKCRKSFESYFRTLTTGCWVEIIVGLEKLHPDVAQHWKSFGEKIDTLCYHPPPKPKKQPAATPAPPPKDVIKSAPPPPPQPMPEPSPEADDDDDDDEDDLEPPKGDVVIKDDFSIPQQYADDIDSEFPDRLVPNVGEKNVEVDKLPFASQHLVGNMGKSLDKKEAVPADRPELPEVPDMAEPHIGPQDRLIPYGAEREKGTLLGLDMN